MIEHKTVDEMIEAWDKGESIWTIEMGGLGPGYEQNIQNMMVEFCRAFRVVTDWDSVEKEFLTDLRDSVYDHYFGDSGSTGAQVGAATSLAAAFCKQGLQKSFDSVPKERRMLVSKNFPHAPDHNAETLDD